LILKVISTADNAVQIQIDKEDYSIADIVHRELLNVKHVKFAGVPPPHPLIKTLTVQVHTDGAPPMKLVNEAVDLAKVRVAELLKEANSIFPREQGEPSSVVEVAPPTSERPLIRSEHAEEMESSEKKSSTEDAEITTRSSP